VSNYKYQLFKTVREEGRNGRFFCQLASNSQEFLVWGVSFPSLSHSSIAMEKGESLPKYSPDTHCSFCLHILKGKKDRRRLTEQDGLVYISGQVALIGPTKMIGAKFACDKCRGVNNARLSVLVLPAAPCGTFFSPALFHNLFYYTVIHLYFW